MKRFILVGLTLSLAAAPILGEEAHFHHVHLNVTDAEASLKFYQEAFGAMKVSYRGKRDAIFTGQAFILLKDVATRLFWQIR